MKIVIIAAVAMNDIIGRSNGEMPWHIKEEFQHFKKTTMGSPIVMGRKTFESLGKPLPGRLNVVLTKSELNFENENVVVLKSLSEAIDECRRRNFEKVFVIGGGTIFPLGMEIADEMIISKIKFDAVGDVKFPKIDDEIWQLDNEVEKSEFTICYYSRKN